MPRTRQVDNYKRDLERIKLRQEKYKLKKLKSNFIKRPAPHPATASLEKDRALMRYFDDLISRLKQRDEEARQFEMKTGLTLEDLKTYSDEQLLRSLEPSSEIIL